LRGKGKFATELARGSLVIEGNEPPRLPSLHFLIQSFMRPPIWIVVLLVLLAVGSQVWQPFSLGFAHDDWYLFVRLHFLKICPNLHVDRPGYYLLSLIILYIWDGSPAEFQWIKVVINLATAASIFWLTLSIQRLFRASSPVLAAASATLWLIAPWGLGYTVWSTAAFTNVALLCFCVSMVQFLRFVERGSRHGLLVAIVLWTISVETYQATWFAFVPVTLAVLLAIYDQAQPRKRALVLASVLLAVQFGSLVHTALTTPKTRNPNAIVQFGANILQIKKIYFGFLGQWICSLALAVLGGSGVAAVLDGGDRYLNLRRIVAGMIMAILGSCGSAALYGAASYGFSGVAEMSKTCVMFTFWIAMGCSVALAADAAETRKNLLGTAMCLVVIAAALFGYPAMARPWVASWTMQREVIEAIKQQSFPQRLELGDVVLSDVPLEVAGISVFGAPWTITPAALSAWADIIPVLARQGMWPVTIVSPYGSKMTWEAGEVTIGPGWTFPAKRLWVWRWRTGDAVLVQTPGPLPPKPFESLFDGYQAQ
jgi:hypothetical protein